MREDDAISPPDFRLFFNRFVRQKDWVYEVEVPNVPEFEEECIRVAKKINERLQKKDLSSIARCRLLGDLGAVSLIACSAPNKGSEKTLEDAKHWQKKILGGLFTKNAWEQAEKIHPLVHSLVTYWRGVYHGPPSPLELTTEKDIISYLQKISRITPSVVDKVRLKGVCEFIQSPKQITNETTTEILHKAFTTFWFRHESLIPKIIDTNEMVSIRKILPKDLA